jgi:Ribbon-helix-helix protein, copG family
MCEVGSPAPRTGCDRGSSGSGAPVTHRRALAAGLDVWKRGAARSRPAPGGSVGTPAQHTQPVTCQTMRMPLTRRTQVLLDDERYARLEERAQLTGASVGALIRQAIDVAFPGAPSDRMRAGQELLDATPIPVEDWDEMKREVLDAHTPRL